MRLALAILLGLVVAATAYYFKLPLKLGAHPFWADQVLVWGTPIGIVLALATMRLHAIGRVIGFVVLTGIAYAIANTGKTRFAASYAEDSFAGQMWFFGWHATFACVIAAFVSASLAKR